GLLARVDAPAQRHAERADGVPDHRDGRMGPGARGHGGVAEFRRLCGLPARRGRREPDDARGALGAPQGRPAVPTRAPPQLQPQVLPTMAQAVLLLRAVERPPARRPRLPPCRVAADAARALGEDTRPDGAMRKAALLVPAVILLAWVPAAARPA